MELIDDVDKVNQEFGATDTYYNTPPEAEQIRHKAARMTSISSMHAANIRYRKPETC